LTLATESITHQIQKIPGYFPDKREFWWFRFKLHPHHQRMASPRAGAIVLALSVLDKLDARVTMATVGNADPAGSVGVEAF
jgi:hypothetical protein